MKIVRDNKEIEITTLLESPEKATVFKHFKGKEYSIVTIGKDSNNLDNLVIYKALYGEGQVWVREYNEFFSEVDKEKYPEIKQKYRFEIKC